MHAGQPLPCLQAGDEVKLAQQAGRDWLCTMLRTVQLLFAAALGSTAGSVRAWSTLPSSRAAAAKAAAATCVPAAPGGDCSATSLCCAVCPDPTDCTTEVQAALDSAAGTVVFSARTWIVRPLHLTRNDTTLVFAPGALVLAKENEFHGPNDNLFAAFATHNLTISGYRATWRMRRADYNNSKLYSKSEGRHGLNLMGCRDTIVEGLRIELSGGDGISVWKGHKWSPQGRVDFCPYRNDVQCACVHLLIRDVVCDRNYRQGMSVMLAENLAVENSIFSRTAGTLPAAGLDIGELDTRMLRSV